MNRRRQPHRIPPPISHGAESMDAEVILHEFPDDVGLFLWKTVRSVRLWGELSDEQRQVAFTREAFGLRMERLLALPVEPDMRELLETAATVLQGSAVHLEAVVTACRLIAARADEKGALGTALEFTQVAALLTPADAELILAVARIARRRSEYARAESWYRQAIAVSRRTHEWISLTGAYLGLGATFLLRGNHPSARQTLIRGIRAAERHSLREERALLSHQMVLVAGRSQRAAELVRHARAALEAYGAAHPRLPVLAVDVGACWARMGHFSEAERLLRAVPPAELGPAERLTRAAALARATAGQDDRAGYEIAWGEAWPLADDGATAREADEALLDLAQAAAAADHAERLRETIKRISKAGNTLGNADRRLEVDSLTQAPASDIRRTDGTTRGLSRDARALSAELVSALHPAAEVA